MSARQAFFSAAGVRCALLSDTPYDRVPNSALGTATHFYTLGGTQCQHYSS